MTGGASGGPLWILSNTGEAYVVAVQSQHYPKDGSPYIGIYNSEHPNGAVPSSLFIETVKWAKSMQ
jgi:hypothetical protein